MNLMELLQLNAPLTETFWYINLGNDQQIVLDSTCPPCDRT